MKPRAILGALILALIVAAAHLHAEEEYITVVVKEGDTLWAIAKKHLKNPNLWPEILKYNEIKDPNLIRPGMVLKIPKSLLKSEPETPEPTPGPGGKLVSAEVVHVSGEVMRIPRNGASEPLKEGSKIYSGDRLVTDISSYVSFSLPAGAQMTVGNDTHLKMEHVEETGGEPGGKLVLNLEKGMVRIKTGKRGLKLELKADSTKVTATNAALQFRFEDDVVKYVEVHVGKATVNSGGSNIEVTENRGAVITGDSVSSPENLPPPPILRAYSFQTDDGHRGGVMWNHLPDVASYRLEIAQDEAFVKTVYIAGYAGTELDFAFFKQFPPGNYAFRLISVNNNGLWGKPSDAMVFQQ